MRNIPVLHVQGETLAETYEKALIELYNNGTRFKTQYDKPGDPLSIDATMNLTVENPLKDPMIHKAFPGGLPDLREYVYELNGLKDDWVKNFDDPKDTRWEYTYSGRLDKYGAWKENNNWVSGFKNDRIIDQFDFVVNKLIKQPFTRQAQMITWMPNVDLNIYDPACMQSIWLRILEDETDGTQYLNYNVRFRSNDAWGANFMNMFGITMMVKERIADKIMSETGRKVVLGRMNWQADSWHVYGKDIQQFKERLLNRLDTTKFEDRVFNFYDQDIQEMYRECEPDLLKKIEEQSLKMKEAIKK